MIEIGHEGHQLLYFCYRCTTNLTLSFLETRKERRNDNQLHVYKIKTNQLLKRSTSLRLSGAREVFFCASCRDAVPVLQTAASLTTLTRQPSLA